MSGEFIYEVDGEITIELSSDWFEDEDIWGCYLLVVCGAPMKMSNDFFELRKYAEALSELGDLEMFFSLTNWMAAVA